MGIIPPALTEEGIPHSLRAIGAFPFLEITAATGILCFLEIVLKISKPVRVVLIASVVLALLSNTAAFTHAYFTQYRAASQIAFQYGMEEAVGIAERDSGRYDYVLFSVNLPQAYIFPLFFAKPDPTEYQRNRGLGKYLVSLNSTIIRPLFGSLW